MSKDIGEVLAGWPFDPRDYTVRIVRGVDGTDKLQVRLDLGLLQMDFHGRPDGQRPHEQESYLHYFQQRQQAHDREHADGPPFQLQSAECELLLREGIQYYHRYLSFWHLRLYELCARDTKRNLELFAFVREYAKTQNEKLQFDQYRPYVTMMHTRAVATPLVELRQWDAALCVVDTGILQIEAFLNEYEQQHRSIECFELQFLKRWRDELIHKRDVKPPPPLASAGPEYDDYEVGDEQTMEKTSNSVEAQPYPLPGNKRKPKQRLNPEQVLAGLHEQLRRAVTEERYEDAARLRDQIAATLEQQPPGDTN